jgi:hypothetical protein
MVNPNGDGEAQPLKRAIAMPHAEIRSNQAVHTLRQLHAELGGNLIDNKSEARRLGMLNGPSNPIAAPIRIVIGTKPQ